MAKQIARTQSEIQSALERRLRDTANDRWSDVEIYDAMNQALSIWDSRVLIPFIYTFTAGFESTEREYALPEYVMGPIDVQYQYSGEDFWRDFLLYDIQPTTSAGSVLRIGYYPADVAMRVVYWAHNGPVPTTVPTLNASITSSSTSLVLASAVNVPMSGYVKIEQEWLQYQKMEVTTASTTTLYNLTRAVFGTTAASHNSAVAVNFGIVVHRSDLYEQLLNQTTAFLHTLFLTNASAHEIETHQWNFRMWQQLAEQFWPRYKPMRQPKMVLTRMGIGQLPRHYTTHYHINETGQVWWD